MGAVGTKNVTDMHTYIHYIDTFNRIRVPDYMPCANALGNGGSSHLCTFYMPCLACTLPSLHLRTCGYYHLYILLHFWKMLIPYSEYFLRRKKFREGRWLCIAGLICEYVFHAATHAVKIGLCFMYTYV